LIPTLNKDDHTYWKGDVRYDAVTHVCDGALGLEASRWWKPVHRLRGTMVHRITEVIDAKCWNPRAVVFPNSPLLDDNIKEGIIQRGFAYQGFIEETGFVSIRNEIIVWSDTMRVAGRIDKLGLFTKGRYAGDATILDVKTGPPTAAAIPQVSLYQLLFQECHEEYGESLAQLLPIKQRVILHLRDDGKCDPEYRNNNNAYGDTLDAMGIVAVYRFKERHKLL
jgi:hypothetical protein